MKAIQQKNSNSEELFDNLVQARNALCVTIHINTHRVMPERRQDSKVLKKTIKSVCELLKSEHADASDNLVERLETIASETDTNHNLDSLGIYVSDGISEVVRFPFSLSPESFVGREFSVRQLLFDRELHQKYFVLCISKEGMHLYSAETNVLTEIKDKDFPVLIPKDEVEFKDIDIRVKMQSGLGAKFEEVIKTKFERVSDQLKGYLQDSTPVFIVSYTKEIKFYVNKIEAYGKILGYHAGTPDKKSHLKLGDISMNAYMDYMKRKRGEAIRRMSELVGYETLAVGLTEVYKAAWDGKGLVLYVEKDFRAGAYIDHGGNTITLKPRADKSTQTYDHAIVETILRTVMDKGGQIIVADNGELDKFDRIAMTLRYS